MTDIDLSGFMGRFRDEAKELLQKLTDGLLALERDPNDKEVVAEITRAAHTLKGNAGFLELTEINKIAHAMEDVLAAIRDGEAEITPELFDLLLSARDEIDNLVQATASQETVSVDAEGIAQQLREAATKKEAPSPPHGGEPADEAEEGEGTQKKKRATVTHKGRHKAGPDKRTLQHFRSVCSRITQRLRGSLAALAKPSDLAKMAQDAHRLCDAAALLEIDEAVQLSDALAALLEASEARAALPTQEGVALIAESIDALDAASSPEDLAKLPPLAEKLSALPASGPSAAASPAQRPSSKPPGGGHALPERTDKQQRMAREETPDTVRVSTSRVDTLVNLTGEIIINQRKAEEESVEFKEILALSRQERRQWASLRSKMLELARVEPALVPSQGRTAQAGEEESLEELLESLELVRTELSDRLAKFSARFEEVVGNLGVTSTRLQEDATRMRMLRLGVLFDVIPRAVRDMARQFGKKIECKISGQETLLDKKMLEGLRGPLVHIIRNSVDHGIEYPQERIEAGKPETGLIEMTAQQEGDRVTVQIRDDGAGIDPEKVIRKALEQGIVDSVEAQTMSPEAALYLVFEPGFTTRAVASDVSGRGVGMDVVRKDIEDLKGEVTLASEAGAGTTVSIRLPLTLAVIPTLLVECTGQKYALPSSSVKKVIEISPSEIHSVEGREAIVCDGRTVPLVSMKDVLRLQGESAAPARGKLDVVIVSHAQDEIGFLVDTIAGEQRLVVKNLAGNLGHIDNVAGGASLGTGEVVIILHLPDLIASAKASAPRRLVEELTKRLAPVERRGRILVVEDSLTTRELQRSILEAAGYQVEVAVDGLDGLRKVSDANYDLVITDVAMPRMDGFEMVQRIKRDPRRKAVPVIIVTSRATEADKKRGMAVGADQFIVKSQFDQSTFLEMVSQFVG